MPIAVLNIRHLLPADSTIVRIDNRSQELAYEILFENVLLYAPRSEQKPGYCGTADVVDVRVDLRAPRFILLELRNIRFFPKAIQPSEVTDPIESLAYDDQRRPIFSYFSPGIRLLSKKDQATIARLGENSPISGLQEAPQASLFDLGRSRETREYTVRDRKLRNATLHQYGAACAVCRRNYSDVERGLYEVEVCHLLAVALGGKDDITNAMPMCGLHHWAYDLGLFTMTAAGDIILGSKVSADLKDEFRGHTRAAFPLDPRSWPHAENLATHRKFVFQQ